ncbi:MAG: hypothetical protein FWG34_06210 [Oscillospiraceae bacterium]|nr:hypothetical protein [Oscillospiraceae bacterium]
MLKVYFVPHTHFDAEVFLTREEYLMWGFSNILDALKLLKKDPEYKFTLEQVCYIEPFLERYPECKKSFMEFIREGRLCITCGMYSMADMNIPSGESLARQFLRGVGYCRENLNANVEIGWTLDSFGHSPNTPQLVKQAGFKYHAFARVTDFACKDFIWRAPDKSEILCHHMPFSYGGIGGARESQAAFDEAIIERATQLKKFAAADALLLAEGIDLGAPDFGIPARIAEFNKTHSDIKIILATPDQYFAEMEKSRDLLQIIEADLNPTFQGVYSSRIEVKHKNRSLEEKLTTAEILSAMAKKTISDKNFGLAWDNVLFNQFHDDLCGCHVDKVFDLIMSRYEFSAIVADLVSGEALKTLSENADTSGEGISVFVFNPLCWERRDFVSVHIGIEQENAGNISVLDSAGKELLFALSEAKHYPDGGLREAFVHFAPLLPSMGYEVFHIVPKSGEPIKTQQEPINPAKKTKFENDFFCVEINNKNGAIESIKLKSGEELIDSSRPHGAMMVKQLDTGDFWELYEPLYASASVPFDKSKPIYGAPGSLYSKDIEISAKISKNALKQEFALDCEDFGGNCFWSKITVYNDIPQIIVEGAIENRSKDVRYLSAIPVNSNAKSAKIIRGIPFGHTETKQGEYPAVDFMDYSDNIAGLTVLNAGIPGNAVKDSVISICLMRAVSYKMYSGGGYSEDESASGGFEIGKSIPFKFALLPHKGECDPATAARAGRELNVPARVHKCGAHKGVLPAKHSFLSANYPNIIATCFKCSPGGYMLRIYETAGKEIEQAEISINLPGMSFMRATAVDFTEKELSVQDAKTNGGKICFPLKANEIRSFKIV